MCHSGMSFAEEYTTQGRQRCAPKVAVSQRSQAKSLLQNKEARQAKASQSECKKFSGGSLHRSFLSHISATDLAEARYGLRLLIEKTKLPSSSPSAKALQSNGILKYFTLARAA